MPELPVKEIRLSELHLPEIKRDEIVRSLSEVRRPTLDIPHVERPTLTGRDGVSRIDWRSIDPTSIGLGRAVAGVAALTRFARPIIRSRWALATGTLVIIGLAGAAILSNAAVRERAGRTVTGVRARIDARAGGHAHELEIEADDLVTTATETVETVAEEIAVAAQEEAASPV